jgi:hypothetical protein
MKDDGGPAFPLHTPRTHEHASETGYLGTDFTMGMTLRDYFAAKAMQSMLGMGYAEVTDMTGTHRMSEAAYIIADAMLKAREE